jgi:Caspase domain
MPESSGSTANFHALLIGIDYYKPNRFYKSLKGAVRDINLVEAFLQNNLQVPPAQIFKLISVAPEDTVLSDIRAADPSQEPTYEHIIQAFQTLTETARSGDQVYIHYAGHGGRSTTIYPHLKQGVAQDEGLVPMDLGDSSEGRYIRDVEMTTLLKRMTDKGLIVTMVLDSCHSGGATRGDVEIRGGTDVDTIARSSESLVADAEELGRNWLDLTSRFAVGTAGLPQSRNYVLLAACRPNEYAYEYAVNGGSERHGALTYWMIDTLTSMASRGQPLTYKLLHDRVHAQIQSKFPQQVPMILGETDRLVFGNSRWATPFTVSVIKVVSETQMTLNAGQAQGLSKGTRFAIYALGTTDFTQQPMAIVEISKVPRAAESTATVLLPEAGGIAVAGSIESGAPAVMVAAPVDLVQRVRLTQKAVGEAEHELPADWAGRQTEALENVRQALAGNGWVMEVQAEESALYQVAIDRSGHYEICIGVPIPNLRPLLSIDDAASAQRVVDRLVHLAKYQAVQSLDNSSSRLAEAIELELLQEDETPFNDPKNPEIQGGDTVLLRLTNTGSIPLKVAVLLAEATWAVSQLPIGGEGSSFFNLDAGEQQQVPLTMNLPEDESYSEAKETLKVFAVQTGLADFRWLTLPALDQPSEQRGSQLNAIQDVRRDGSRAEFDPNPVRGMKPPEAANPLNALMKMIGADLDQAPQVTRSATVVVDPKQEWLTKQVQILIKR